MAPWGTPAPHQRPVPLGGEGSGLGRPRQHSGWLPGTWLCLRLAPECDGSTVTPTCLACLRAARSLGVPHTFAFCTNLKKLSAIWHLITYVLCPVGLVRLQVASSPRVMLCPQFPLQRPACRPCVPIRSSGTLPCLPPLAPAVGFGSSMCGGMSFTLSFHFCTL